ncbi:hypothetical protein [Streptomyces tauricus]|uniref:hypothetical protein n=1 Tax=Streptomyces tauricus TaxID=68274 RepID=UPI00224432E0|nr:hypothetical protein [Streptomyces tauricus]MCW8101720.1 hypothetical protein [Streptomyces tauricus]
MSVHPVLARPGRRHHLPEAAAIVDPCPWADYARALARRDTLAVAVTSSPVRPRVPADTTGYRHTLVHNGGLARTSRRLHGLGVRAVLAGSPRGIPLAERLAAELHLPADPATVLRRCDRGEQARVLSQAQVDVPCTWRTDELTAALAWWRISALPAIWLLPAAVGVPATPMLCRSSGEITAAWRQLRRTAHLHSGSGHLVLREHLSGRRYTAHSLTRPAPEPDHEPVHTVTDVWSHSHTASGLLARVDLLPRHGMLARALALYTLRVLQVLGVRAGGARCHLIYEPERGPLLLSAAAAADSSPADQALQAATGIDRLGGVLDTVLPPGATALMHPSTRRHVVRVRLNARCGGVLDPDRLAALRALPTVVHLTDTLTASAPVEPMTSSHTAVGEVVLSHPRTQAIEADYQHIRRLEATGLYLSGGNR